MPSYRTREYGTQITFGMKVAAVLILFGAMLCLWVAVPDSEAEDKDFEASTARLVNGVRDGILEMEEKPLDASDAWQKLADLVRCSACEGSGTTVNDDGEELPCPVCGGIGVSAKQGPGLRLRRYLLDKATCTQCRGVGKRAHATCRGCNGTGYDREKVASLVNSLAAGGITDAWGRKLKLTIDDVGKELEVEVRSAGSDGRFKSRDDIVAGGI